MALRVIIYGGNGALGKVIVSHFKSKNHYVASIDLVPNESADDNIIIKNLSSWTEQHAEVAENVGKVLAGDKVDAIFCVAGGWAGGNAASKNYVKNADMMWKQSAWSSIIAGNLASQYLKDGGILQLTGASPALEGTSGMIGYGMAKAAVHQLCKSLAANNSGMPPNSSTLCILPITLDTPMNRQNMPKADFSSWTPLEFIAELFCSWAKGESRAASGSLLQIKTESGKTQLNSV